MLVVKRRGNFGGAPDSSVVAGITPKFELGEHRSQESFRTAADSGRFGNYELGFPGRHFIERRKKISVEITVRRELIVSGHS